MSHNTALEAISQALLKARRSALPLSSFPGELPGTLRDAYAIQSMSIDRWPDQVAGWKVGGIAPSQPGGDEADRLAGPIFKTSVRHIAAGATICVPIYDGGFAAIEAEFVLQLAREVKPASRDWTDEELLALIDIVYAGAEIASSPMASINQIGPPAVISDFGNNNGLLLGPELVDWKKRNADGLQLRVTVDNDVVGDKVCSDSTTAPLAALRFLLQLCATRGLSLSKGTLISTGAVTGIHDVTIESASSVEFVGVGQFNVRFEAAQASL